MGRPPRSEDEELVAEACLAAVALLRVRTHDLAATDPMDTVTDPVFWEQLGKFVAISTPIVKLLRVTDRRDSLMCRVYDGFFMLVQDLEQLKTDPAFVSEDDQSLLDTVISHTNERWDYVHHDIHGAGYCLDPTNLEVVRNLDGCNDEVVRVDQSGVT